MHAAATDARRRDHHQIVFRYYKYMLPAKPERGVDRLLAVSCGIGFQDPPPVAIADLVGPAVIVAEPLRVFAEITIWVADGV